MLFPHACGVSPANLNASTASLSDFAYVGPGWNGILTSIGGFG
jgi:hypothetical protein